MTWESAILGAVLRALIGFGFPTICVWLSGIDFFPLHRGWPLLFWFLACFSLFARLFRGWVDLFPDPE